LGSFSDEAVVPFSFALVERYAKLKWLCRLYPIII